VTLLRAIGRNALVWCLTWGGLGVLWIFSGKSTGDVMGGSEMWPFMAIGGSILGIPHGALYGMPRHWIIPFASRPIAEASNTRRRMIAGSYGAAAGGLPWLLFQPALGAFLLGLGIITAAAIPGSVYAAER
jgi:hypothetical protein